MVTISALYFSGVVKVKDLWTFNLLEPEHRVDMVLACLNVARLLLVLGLLCHEHNLKSDTMVIGDERQGELVKLYGSSVKKTFNSSDFGYHVLQI
jgi:hypothetical protein